MKKFFTFYKEVLFMISMAYGFKLLFDLSYTQMMGLLIILLHGFLLLCSFLQIKM